MNTMWPETPSLTSDTVEEAFLDLFTIPVDSTSLDISDGSSIFDCLLWPDSEVLTGTHNSNAPEDSTEIDVNTTEDHIFDEQSVAIYEQYVHVPADGPLASNPSSGPDSDVLQSLELTPGHKRLQDCLYEFEGGPNTAPPRRKRRKFSSERRKEVFQMRKVGA